MTLLQQNKKSILKFTLSLTLSLIFVYLTVSKVNINESIHSLEKINYFFLIPAIFVHMVGFFIRTRKWQILVEQIKVVKYFELYKILVIGFMFNNILPFRLGEFIRCHLLGKDLQISRSGVLGTIFIEKLSDAIALILIILLFSILFVQTGNLSQNLPMVALVIIILIIIMIFSIVYEKKIIQLLEKLQSHFKIRFIFNLLTSFISGLKTVKSPSTLFKIGLYSLLIWIFEAIPYYIISLAFNFNLNFLQLLLVCSIVNLGLLIPSSPGYIGTFHFFCVLVLVALGISQNTALSFAIIIHLVLFIPITLIGITFFLRRKKDITT